MLKVYKTFVITTLLFLAGCQAVMYGTGADLNNVKLGMTTAQVIGILGQPSSVGADSTTNTEKLYYRKMGKATDWEPTSYEVELKDGKVIKFGEVSK